MSTKLTLIFTYTFAAILITGLYSDAKAQNFQEGDLVLNAGIGIGTTFSTFGGASFGLPLGAGIEYGITDLETGSIGLGGDFGFVTSSGITVLTFGVRGSYYFTELFDIDNPDLDIYGGLGLYHRSFNTSSVWGEYSWGSGIYAAFHAGARYYFADNIGGFAELGNNWGWLNVGIVFKL